jgi:ferritin-like metal-binding protein YciE
MKSMEELFHAQLQDVYFAEKQLLKALSKLAKNSTNEQLAQAFSDHLKETEGQVDRLEKVFELIEKKPRGRKCDAILGIIAEGQDVIEDVDDDAVRDAGLVAAGQAAEHYEIARYIGRLGAIARSRRCRGASQQDSRGGKEGRRAADLDCSVWRQ